MRIEVTHEADRLVASIADDGIGGVEVGAGSGLRGLADRLEAVGGHLELRSAPGEGTRLRAWVPLA
jgi:signal transduction histidine kinase